MNQLPKIRWNEDPNREKLASWFALRDADLALRKLRVAVQAHSEAPSDDLGPSLRALASPGIHSTPISEFDFDVALGDIRLLSPRLSPTADRPVYVVVFRDWEDGKVLIAPYSPYSLAATRTELEFPNRSLSLRVVCAWNALTAHPLSIAESWKIDVLSADEMQEIWQVFRSSATGQPLPENLFPRIGCPIRRPSDPRIAYQQEESEIFRVLTAINLPQEDQDLQDCVPITEIPLDALELEALPLAALSRQTVSAKGEEFLIPGLRSHICLYRASMPGEILLVVYESDGDVSRLLDFSAVCGSGNQRFATIHEGMARWIGDSSTSGVRIVLPTGQTLKLFRKLQG